MNTITLQQDTLKDFLPIIQSINFGNNLQDKIKLSLAIGLFLTKAVSLAKAADLAERSLSDFVDILTERGLFWAEYTDEHLRQDTDSINTYFNQNKC